MIERLDKWMHEHETAIVEETDTVRGKIIYAGITPKTIDPAAPYGDISNPMQSIKEAFDAGAAGVIVFSETNAEDWRLVMRGENK